MFFKSFEKGFKIILQAPHLSRRLTALRWEGQQLKNMFRALKKENCRMSDINDCNKCIGQKIGALHAV